MEVDSITLVTKKGNNGPLSLHDERRERKRERKKNAKRKEGGQRKDSFGNPGRRRPDMEPQSLSSGDGMRKKREAPEVLNSGRKG